MSSGPKNPGRMNRREFLKLSGLGLVMVSAGSMLSGCALGGTKAPKEEIGGTLDFLSWEGYDLPTCMQEWQDANGVTVSATYIGDHNEIQAKLTAAQGAGYDLTTYYHGYADLYTQELGLFQPLDPDQVPNAKKLYELFQTGDFWVKDGTIWGVPFTWGAEGSNYNADKIEAPASWHDLLKPEFKGLVGMVDDSYGQVVVAGRAVGLDDSLPNLTPEQLEEIKQFLLAIKGQARGIAPSFGDLTDMLVSGEVVVTFPGWAAVNVWAQERGVNVQHTLPAEGGFAFIDAFAVPKDSDNAATAMAWINEALSPEVQACQAAALAAGVVNPDAVALLDEATKSLYDYSDVEGVFENAPFYGLPPTESDEFATYDDWLLMWEEVKAE